MNIILSILIAILTIFALKTKNKQQISGLGDRRFLIAIVCAVFPYLDYSFTFLSKPIELAYHNTFLSSIILTPVYALGLTAFFNTIFGNKVDAKFLFPSILGTMLVVLFFNLLGTTELALFYPFSDIKFSFNILHSFNLILFLILAAGVIMTTVSKTSRRDAARVSLAVVAIFLLAVFSFAIKARFAASDYAKALNLEVTETHVLAQPLSVFNWRLMLMTKDGKIHDSFITLRDKPLEFKNDGRTNRVAQLYRPSKKAVWRIYRQVNPNYKKQFDVIVNRYGDNQVMRNTLKYSILKDAVNYQQYRCLRFKDLRTEGIRKSLKGNTLFCQNPKTKDFKVLYGTKETYEDITNLF